MIALLRRLSLLFLLLSNAACTSFIFQPQTKHFYTPGTVDVAYEDIYLQVRSDIKLHGWKLLAEGGVKGTVLFFHGNGVNISTHISNVYWLTQFGYDVYLFDYRGYGKSDSYPELGNILYDNEIIIKYVTDQLAEEKKLTIIGHSLGGSLAIYSTAVTNYKDKIKLLISVEAFSDYQHVTQEVLSRHWLTWLIQYPVSWMMNNDYKPLDFIAKVSPVKTLIMHSKQDEIIDFYHAEALYEAASQPKAFEAVKGGHNQVFDVQQNRELLLKYMSSE